MRVRRTFLWYYAGSKNCSLPMRVRRTFLWYRAAAIISHRGCCAGCDPQHNCILTFKIRQPDAIASWKSTRWPRSAPLISGPVLYRNLLRSPGSMNQKLAGIEFSQRSCLLCHSCCRIANIVRIRKADVSLPSSNHAVRGNLMS
jgi:hypothetical protein